ncbi:hypothetical protein NA8A_04813 [Nitratireductor indicus C115]|uniref:Uncharacterized protein n=1 Tax=Nitratireductor indicus C115 TaxID=1231190 RepID=K2NZG9_9HYPH|nr:hypothetical protein [Nitratireductor indicus]EKF43324.1 hypothetical protein NA8A_04813 [Nitratireductor indicus C115]SFQ10019.1 hypothetical protein SAMN05216176_101342 [Nitratireductor indicus]
MTEQQPDKHGVDADEELREIDGLEPSAEALIEALGSMLGGSGGWGDIESDGAAMLKQRAEQSKRAQQQANQFRDCFSTTAGRATLEYMLDETLRAEPFPLDAMLSREQIEPLLLMHYAQCQFVRAILSAMAQATPVPADRGQDA